MFRNYFFIAWRQLKKEKMYSAIKLGGFALSIAACILISLYIVDELSYDRFWPNEGRFFRVTHEFNNDGRIAFGTDFQAPFADALRSDYPEIEKVGRIMPHSLFYGAGSNLVMTDSKSENVYEEGFSYADQEILDMFQIPMVYGQRSTALTEPNTIVISKKKADKFFPGQNPVGKIIYLNKDKSRPFKITAVMQDFPHNSHLTYDFLLTLKGVELWKGEQTNWGATNYYTYVLLRPGTNARSLESRLLAINKKYIGPVLSKLGIKNVQKQLTENKYHLQPVKEIYLRSENIYDQYPHGDIKFVWMFGAIAFFILFNACINFINLTTAKSANRAKEVGIRKVVGSYRIHLIRQFLTESMVFSFISFIIGLLIAWLMMPFFNMISGKSISFPWKVWWLLPLCIGCAGLVGLAAGIYPSFYLSAFKPIRVLKGQLSRGSRNATLRSVLVVFQFTTSVILIVGTITIYRQFHFILNRKIGFEKDQVMIIQGTNSLESKIKTFKDELKRFPQIRSASISDYIPVAGMKRNGNAFWNDGRLDIDAPANGQFWVVDEDYIRTMGMHLVEGRNFSRDIASDTLAVILNQEMVKRLNLREKPIGKKITNGDAARTIVGVVQDFNFESMRSSKIGGVCLIFGISPSIMSIKLKAQDAKPAIAAVQSLWKEFVPEQPIRFSFLDENFAMMYADVERTRKIFSSFAILAIIIACLGLFALSAFMAEQRTREIGVRKVLGASVAQVTTLLSSGFIKLVMISLLIAIPISWWAMHSWLQDFVYRIQLGWLSFIATFVIVIMIALATISFQSIKAAIANPAKALRAE
jgi:putative ABC transport system permease protein